MKKKLFTLLFAVAASVGMMNAEVINGSCGTNLTWSLNTEDSTLTISGTGAMSNYNISNNPVPWKQDTALIKYLILEDGITYIGTYAFYNCINLVSVTFPNSVESMGNYVFQFCSSLTSVTIPQNVTSIGKQSFRGCSGLKWFACKAVTPPTLGSDVFYSVHRKTPMFVPAESNDAYKNAAWWSEFVNYPIIHGNCGDNLMWYLSSDTTMLNIVGTGAMKDYPAKDCVLGSYQTPWYNNCSSITSVTIGNSVTSIGEGAFGCCRRLTSVTIPNSVTSIGNEAFAGCSSLTSVTIGTGVTSIGGYAFYQCSSLTSVTIGNSVTSIGEYAFSGCSSLTSVTIPNSVTSIGHYAFSGCSSLTSVTIPNSVTSIGGGAFSRCSSLTSVTIPNSVTSIGGSAFSGCSSLTSVTIPNSVTSIGDEAFYNCSSLTSVTIGTGVTSIGDEAFYNCSSLTSVVWNAKNCNAYYFGIQGESFRSQVESFTFGDEVEVIPSDICRGMTKLTSVTIGNSVTSIGDWAFVGCSSLTSVTIPNSVTSIGDQAFYGCSSLTSIYVPCGTLDAYKNAEGWSDYASKIKYASYPSYTITKIANNGYISTTATEFTICDEPLVECTAKPQSGCYFVRWADGNTENPRTIELSHDTTMEAIFDYLLTGKCGKDSALTWTFEPASMALNITGKGALSENYTYGTFIESLTIGNEVTTIGEWAFGVCNNLKTVIIGSSVKVLEAAAFAYCSSIETITCYSQRPPTVNQDALYGLDYSTIVYVPADYFETYNMHDAWGLYDVRPLGAKSTETTDVNVTPAENTADVAWPAVSGAATYELVIKDKNGNVICTLTFNAKGQLTQIAFNAPSRNNTPQQTQAAGFSFTVTGLNSGTTYNYTLTTKDSGGNVIDTQTGSFKTAGTATDIEDVSNSAMSVRKVVRDGVIYLLMPDGRMYDLQGAEVK